MPYIIVCSALLPHKTLLAQRIPLSMNKAFQQNIAWREDAGNFTPSKGPLRRPRESEKTVQRGIPF